MKIQSILAVLLLLTSIPALGNPSNEAGNGVPLSLVFYHLDRNVAASFTDRGGLNHFLAIGSSICLVAGGVDKAWNDYSRNHSAVSRIGFVSVGVGGLVPILVPAGLYLYGRGKNDRDLQITGLALGQAAFLGLAVSSAYKAITGRQPPPESNDPNPTNDRSKDFHFGFFRRGVFEGWPSSHATIAFAMGTALRELYPDNRTVQFTSWVYPSLVALGVSTNIHWLSDAVAGSLIGYSIGKAVGLGFKGLRDGRDSATSFQFYPMNDGIGLCYRF